MNVAAIVDAGASRFIEQLTTRGISRLPAAIFKDSNDDSRRPIL